MLDLLLRTAAEASKTYEIVVAILIVIMTMLVLYFLYRNVAKELQEWKLKRDTLSGKSKDNEEEEEEYESDDELIRLLDAVDKKISSVNEGDLAIFYYINIDDFHYLVEKYDPKQVDKVIAEINKKLKKHSDKSGVSGHLKDDEFVYFHLGEVNNDIINEQADKLLELFREPLRSVEETLTCSIGITVFPYDGSNADHLFKNAGLALYVAKKEGKDRYHLYSEELLEKEQFNISYYKEIKNSIENDEFLLYYQPILDIRTGTIIGFESLLRWNHPTMGILPPGKFLNVMDLSGDITWFGAWGFEKIVKQYKYWRERIKFRDMFLSTNLSPKQIMIEGLAHQFFNITKKQEMPPELFCMEIIDYYSVVNSPVAMHNLNEFRKFGFRIAIDDTGKDFEIISDLQNISAGIFKVNRNNLNLIIDNAEDSDKIYRTIETAKKLQKMVIVEGIENEDMIKRMTNWELRFMQGYYFSEPISTDEVEVMLKSSPWSMTSFNHLFEKKE